MEDSITGEVGIDPEPEQISIAEDDVLGKFALADLQLEVLAVHIAGGNNFLDLVGQSLGTIQANSCSQMRIDLLIGIICSCVNGDAVIISHFFEVLQGGTHLDALLAGSHGGILAGGGEPELVEDHIVADLLACKACGILAILLQQQDAEAGDAIANILAEVANGDTDPALEAGFDLQLRLGVVVRQQCQTLNGIVAAEGHFHQGHIAGGASQGVNGLAIGIKGDRLQTLDSRDIGLQVEPEDIVLSSDGNIGTEAVVAGVGPVPGIGSVVTSSLQLILQSVAAADAVLTNADHGGITGGLRGVRKLVIRIDNDFRSITSVPQRSLVGDGEAGADMLERYHGEAFHIVNVGSQNVHGTRQGCRL